MHAALIAVVLTAAGTAPPGREFKSYKFICEKLHLDELAALPPGEHDRVEVRLTLKPESGPAEVTWTIAAAAGPITVVTRTDGTIDLPVRKDLLAEDPMIFTSVPKDVKTAVGIGLTPLLPPGLTFSYLELVKPVDQANRLIKAQAGLLSFAAPKMKGVTLQFDGPGKGVTISGKGVDLKLTADDKGLLQLKVDDDLKEKNPAVTLPEPPKSVAFIY
jgi:hypothetical protein